MLVIFMLVILELDRYIEAKNVEGVQKVNIKKRMHFYAVFNISLLL